MSKSNGSDSLDIYFWRSSEGHIVFSPMLWLGKSYQITDKNEEINIRRQISSSKLYNIRYEELLKSSAFSGCTAIIAIFAIAALALYFFATEPWHYQIPVGMIVLTSVIIEIIFHINMMIEARKYPTNIHRMTYERYQIQNIMCTGERKYLDGFTRNIRIVLFCSFLIVVFAIQDNRMFWILGSICVYGFTINKAHAVEAYYLSRLENTEPEKTEAQRSSVAADAPNGSA
ncbi:MAG: hypothetical protein ACR2QJ_04785 [Geminicoccaceae bacterium]